MQTTGCALNPDHDRTSNVDTYMFDTCGYVRHERYLSQDNVTGLLQLLAAHWPPAPRHGVRRINGLSNLSNDFRDLAASLADKLGLYTYINQPFRLIESYALHRVAGSVQSFHNGFSEPNVSKLGKASRAMWRHHTYHDGKLYSMMVKALLYLTDISSEEDGPFCYIEGSHKANIAFPMSAELEHDSAFRFRSLRLIYPAAGDVSIINEALMHGTLPKSSSAPRIIMAFSFAPSFVADYQKLSGEPADIWSMGFCE